MDFKERVFQARKAKGLSQEDLAEAVGVSRQAVSKWETGEAMPDMEKFIALCAALDLNIEYLALGKVPTPPAPSPKKPLLMLVISLLAVACFGVGFLFGRRETTQNSLETTLPPDTTQSQQQLLISGPISDFSAKPINKSTLELFILPKMFTEGMDVSVVCEDKILNKSQTHTCTFDGTFYRLRLSRSSNYRYYITAILNRNGEKEQIPLAEISGDEYSCHTVHLWKD